MRRIENTALLGSRGSLVPRWGTFGPGPRAREHLSPDKTRRRCANPSAGSTSMTPAPTNEAIAIHKAIWPIFQNP
jgi:hypothetical protein